MRPLFLMAILVVISAYTAETAYGEGNVQTQISIAEVMNDGKGCLTIKNAALRDPSSAGTIVKKEAEVKVPQEKFFDTGKVKINYLDYGNSSREPLVMLHGGAWSWQEYLSLLPSLFRRHELYTGRLPGRQPG